MTSVLPIDRLRGFSRIGFLYSGGSSRCVFQVGVTEALFSLGIRPVMCLGVSGGAWNAAAVAVGNGERLRSYWRFFSKMQPVDLRNLLKEHSPFRWRVLHERAFRRYVGAERIRNESTLPLFVAVTRMSDRASVILDVRAAADPLLAMLASNYLPPFYTHAPVIDGVRYGDGGFSDNIPYGALFERGCDAVVLMASKGESEGGLYRNASDYEHEIPESLRDRVFVIRPRHRLPLAFVERRWDRLEPIANLGALRAREVLLDERYPETDLAARGKSFTRVVADARAWMRRSRLGRLRAGRAAGRTAGTATAPTEE